jgi:hypothetical protein
MTSIFPSRGRGKSIFATALSAIFQAMDKEQRKQATKLAGTRNISLYDIWPTLGLRTPRRTSNRYPSFTKAGPGRYRPNIEEIRARRGPK